MSKTIERLNKVKYTLAVAAEQLADIEYESHGSSHVQDLVEGTAGSIEGCRAMMRAAKLYAEKNGGL